MVISELIARLNEVMAENGDIPVELYRSDEEDEWLVYAREVVVCSLGKSCLIDG